MDLYLIRHAIAFNHDPVAWPEDGERPLTRRGKRLWRRAARGLGDGVLPAQVVLSSPLPRAWETATILEEEAGWPAPTRCDALAQGSSPEAALLALREQKEEGPVAVVGHEPGLHELTSYLLTADPKRLELEFKKGGAAFVRFPEGPDPGTGVLRWLLTARALRALRD